jgi:hypothetical protein
MSKRKQDRKMRVGFLFVSSKVCRHLYCSPPSSPPPSSSASPRRRRRTRRTRTRIKRDRHYRTIYFLFVQLSRSITTLLLVKEEEETEAEEEDPPEGVGRG